MDILSSLAAINYIHRPEMRDINYSESFITSENAAQRIFGQLQDFVLEIGTAIQQYAGGSGTNFIGVPADFQRIYPRLQGLLRTANHYLRSHDYNNLKDLISDGVWRNDHNELLSIGAVCVTLASESNSDPNLIDPTVSALIGMSGTICQYRSALENFKLKIVELVSILERNSVASRDNTVQAAVNQRESAQINQHVAASKNNYDQIKSNILCVPGIPALDKKHLIKRIGEKADRIHKAIAAFAKSREKEKLIAECEKMAYLLAATNLILYPDNQLWYDELKKVSESLGFFSTTRRICEEIISDEVWPGLVQAARAEPVEAQAVTYHSVQPVLGEPVEAQAVIYHPEQPVLGELVFDQRDELHSPQESSPAEAMVSNSVVASSRYSPAFYTPQRAPADTQTPVQEPFYRAP